MSQTMLRDAAGRVYAFINTEHNGDQTIRPADGVPIGRYYKGMDMTMDLRSGRQIAKGNALMALVQPPIY